MMIPFPPNLSLIINPALFMIAVILAFMIHKGIWLCIMFIALIILSIEYLYQSIKTEMNNLRVQHHHSFDINDNSYDGDTDGSDIESDVEEDVEDKKNI